MMQQQTLAGSGFEKYRKKTRKEQFLEDMEQIIPWKELTAAIAPYYPNPLLSQPARRRPPSGRPGTHAPHPFSSALV